MQIYTNTCLPNLIETQFDPDAGTMIILMDSVRKRLFSKSTRLAIASKLAPIQVGIFLTKKTTEKNSKLTRFFAVKLNTIWMLEKNEIASNSRLF
jgi:glycyl-tRNA synthetase (class II)